jgi:flotillin
VAIELNKVGLELINVNIKDITDESGYIEAIGKKAAAEAVNKARVEVAEQESSGSMGEAKAKRQKEVQVAAEEAQSDEGIKQAESKRRIKVATLEAEAVKGENESKAEVADYDANLAEKTAEAERRSKVAHAISQQKILEAEKESELTRLEKEQIVQKEIDKRMKEIEAEAEAEQSRRLAKGDADAVRLRYEAEAEGLQKLLAAKADGYKGIINACAGDAKAASTLLLIEKLEELVKRQTEAMSNLKIDKITVWDSGKGQDGQSTTSGFIRNLFTSLPPIHELAKQAGIDLPNYLGNLQETPLVQSNGQAPVERKQESEDVEELK